MVAVGTVVLCARPFSFYVVVNSREKGSGEEEGHVD